MIGFTQLNWNPSTYPSEMSFTSPLDRGTVYQIATPNDQKSDAQSNIILI